MSLPVPISSDLLSPQAWSEILAINSQLAHAYATNQIFRTETEARISVLNDLHFPTRASKYWQSVREQCVMLEQLALLSFEWRRNELAIRRLQGNGHDEAAQIDLDEAQWKRANMQRVAADRAREVQMWEKLKRENDDGSFSTENVDEHQLTSLTVRFLLRALTIDSANMNGGEMDNLVGQLRTALAHAQAAGIVDEVMTYIPAAAQDQLRQQRLLQ